MTAHDIRFDQLNLVAADPDATVAFYRRLGVPIDEAGIWRTESGPHHTTGVTVGGTGVEIEIDSPKLAAEYNAGYRSDPRASMTLGFRLPSREAVDALHAELVGAGYESRQEPFDAFFGCRYAIVADPDGRDVGLMSPQDPSHGSPPPDL